MANTLWRVPIAAKMHPLQAEIRGHQQFAPGYNAENSGIISYSNSKFPTLPESGCLTANGGDELSFGSRQGRNNIPSSDRVRSPRYNPRLP